MNINEMVIQGQTDLSDSPAAIYLSGYTDSTRDKYTDQLRYLAELMGIDDPFTVNWSGLKYKQTQMLRNMLLNQISPRSGERLSAATINLRLAALRGVLRVAWQLGEMSSEDFLRATNLKDIKSDTLPSGRSLTVSEVHDLLNTCSSDFGPSGYRDSAILALLYGSGLRREEIVRINLSDYRPKEQQILIHGKGRRERIAYLTNGSAVYVSEWLEVRGNEPGPMFLKVDKSGRIHQGERLSSGAIYAIISKRRKLANVDKFSPHDLRRSYVSHLLDKGVDIALVSRLVGHSSVTVTQLYDLRGRKAEIKATNLLHVPYYGHERKTDPE